MRIEAEDIGTTVAPPSEVGAPRPRRAVVFYGVRPPELLSDTLTLMREGGVHVTLVGPPVSRFRPSSAQADEVIKVRFRASPAIRGSARPPRRLTPAWAWLVARNVGRRYSARLVGKVAGRPTMLWWALQGDRRVRDAVARADVLTALDAVSVYSVWQYARRHPGAAAISGLRPTLERLGLAE